jgi:hypothetical protein
MPDWDELRIKAVQARQAITEIDTKTERQENGFYDEETDSQTFRQSAISELLRSGVPGSYRNLCIAMSQPDWCRAFAEIEYSIRTGKPALDHVAGKPFFELFTDDYYGAAFHSAMTDWSAPESPAVAAAYDFSAIRNLCDVSGGSWTFIWHPDQMRMAGLMPGRAVWDSLGSGPFLGPQLAYALACHPRSQSTLQPPSKSLSRGWWLSSPPRFQC